VIIRAAVLSDADALAALHSASFNQAWSAETLADFIATASVSLYGEPPTGFLILKSVFDEAEIITIGIDPQQRTKGLGRALLSQGLADLQAQGVGRVFLEVATDNVPALALYRSFGFIQIGMRKGYYARLDGSAIDALMLSLTLDARDKNTHIRTK
jgi:[ribosomal protein S18]-alanine N-acetyltransferase